MAAKVKREFKRGEVLTVRIVDVAFGGKGVAKIPTEKGDFTVFVMNTLPGQLVQARVDSCKSRYAECKLDKVLEPAPEEVVNDFQAIPGAPYARLPIEIQLKYKERTALDVYRKIGLIENLDGVYSGLMASPEVWHYRNKMEYSFSAIGFDHAKQEEFDGFALGFKHRGTWWVVENLDADSGLFDAEVEGKLKLLREWCEKTGFPAWHPPKREGFFRFFVVRKSFAANKLLINLVTTSDNLSSFDRQGFVDKCLELWGDRVQGILHTINDDRGERVEAREGNSKVVYGELKIKERINDLDFSISMSSFFQTNPKSAEKLYDLAVSWAGDTAHEGYLMDLFCGTGTIGQLLARGTGRNIIGVDIVESAIEDAKQNARENGVENVSFHAADVGKFLVEFPEYAGKIATIVLDPPRGGIAPKSLKKIIALGAPRIIYVSCNPATQARDILTLREDGYELLNLKLVDQFPHTSHVEAVALFEKK
ncbi:MAG: 23S rRNA (uracil(1939)-C(5))-methyltransferase RlmD [Cryomorphaceae bacterium]|nr:23S rRNA (uracil(1939)-C(5))-methyltransferase RlmD [Cryomorphaceae bacterium]